jgi:hypothetical protein
MPAGRIEDQPASAFGNIFQRFDRQVMNTESNLARHVVSRKHEADGVIALILGDQACTKRYFSRYRSGAAAFKALAQDFRPVARFAPRS